MNFLRQGFRMLSSDRHTDIQTDTTEITIINNLLNLNRKILRKLARCNLEQSAISFDVRVAFFCVSQGVSCRAHGEILPPSEKRFKKIAVSARLRIGVHMLAVYCHSGIS